MKQISQAMLDAALSYARRGWWVFPVPPGAKCGYSIKKRGFDNGQPWGKSKSAAEIRAYWKKLPRANIGLPMGIGSGIFDVECDTIAGHSNLKQDGALSLAALEEKHGALPPTLMFVSPSGSEHRLFRHPGGDIRIRSGALDKDSYPGIDVKGDGGMSVAPPSKTRKDVYRWINKRRIATAPEWLLDLVRKPARVPRKSDGEPQADIAELTLAMEMIPNDDLDWDNWNRVGMALYAATGGSAEGLRLFDAWSHRSSKYDAAVTLDKWSTKFDHCPPSQLTAGTIIYLADEAVPGWQGRQYYDPGVIARIDEFLTLMGDEHE